MTEVSLAAGRSAPRRVRSFVRREGRMTDGQRRALQQGWERYGVEADAGLLDLAALFGRVAPCALEIGCGMGDAIVAMAQARPDWNFIGVEVYRPGVGSLLHKLEERDLGNVRVISADAVMILEQMMPAGSLDAVYLFFPDPWPKRRHHKRRLVQASFSTLVARALRSGGIWHLATDWEDYARQMGEVLGRNADLEPVDPADARESGLPERPATKFEARGRRLGHGIRDLVYRRR